MAQGQFRPAEIAFGHLPRNRVELGRRVWAGPFTIAAAHTFVGIHTDDTVFILIHGGGGAGLNTNGLMAMVAANRKVVSKHVLTEGAVRPWDPLAAVGGLQILVCQGFAAADFSFTLAAVVWSEPSGICIDG